MSVTRSGTEVVSHFTARAKQYDQSSRWCTDPEMMRFVLAVSSASKTDRMLDVACGTGLVAGAFRPKVSSIVGIDVTPAMAAKSLRCLDSLVLGSAENMPFRDAEFDLTVCRQGIQFMDAPKAAREMVRVTNPGGHVLLVNLCAYGSDDSEEFFEILRLRNPARRGFFVPFDLENLLRVAGCREVQCHSHISEEDVDLWADNGAFLRERTCAGRVLLPDLCVGKHRHRCLLHHRIAVIHRPRLNLLQHD